VWARSGAGPRSLPRLGTWGQRGSPDPEPRAPAPGTSTQLAPRRIAPSPSLRLQGAAPAGRATRAPFPILERNAPPGRAGAESERCSRRHGRLQRSLSWARPPQQPSRHLLPPRRRSLGAKALGGRPKLRGKLSIPRHSRVAPRPQQTSQITTAIAWIFL
jgi:hypothetical protein